MVCKNLCLEYGVNITNCVIDKPYHNGLKFCIRCEKYFDTSLIHCFCCGRKLRTKAVVHKYEKVKRY